jgi:nucleoside-diphosphate-sugar epimerase
MAEPTILLTGATGIIGGGVLAQAAQRRIPARWLLLVRGTDIGTAHERLAQRLERYLAPARAREFLDRCDIVLGDLGTVHELADPRLNQVTHVLHLAADTSYWSREKSWEVNYEGTLRLAERARRMPRLERFLHVGTAFISGEGSSGHFVHEDEYPAKSATHVVFYAHAKAEAEFALQEKFADLPLIVARPSIVAGHRTLGASPSGSIFWAIRAVDQLRLVSCDPAQGGIDLVPIDWTADALIDLLFKPSLQHRCYHLSAGNTSRTYIRDVERAFERLEPAGGPRAYRRIDHRDLPSYRDRIVELFGRRGSQTILVALGQYLQFVQFDVSYDNSRLQAEGIAPPPSLPEYLDTCLGHAPNILDQFNEDRMAFRRQRRAAVATREPGLTIPA